MKNAVTRLAPVVGLVLGLCCLALTPSIVAAPAIPEAPREFRGLWVASVGNLDWPSKRGLSAEQQRQELIGILDRARQMRMNAIIFQVRPACDALYASRIEPWSGYLSGEQGQNPGYDPLEFAIQEAHRRGLELHAWFNPFRAAIKGSSIPLASNHISKRRPDLVRDYGDYLWLDPGEKDVQDYSASVVLDVARRYDVDGIHFDDYFYPYLVKDSKKQIVEFPDDVSYKKYQAAGGKLEKKEWRRESINSFVQLVSQGIHQAKPQVKFGISPFGIWKPGNPQGVVGLNSYEELASDSRKWLQEGWVDYLSPQLYWKISAPQQSFPSLLNWWVEQNTRNHHLWPGLFTSKFEPSEIVAQIGATRKQRGATGHIHFSAKTVMQNKGGMEEQLRTKPYALPALVPASPWLGNKAPAAPGIQVGKSGNDIAIGMDAGGRSPWLWTVYLQIGNSWLMDVVPGGNNTYSISPAKLGGDVRAVAVGAVDRVGNESQKSYQALNAGGAQ
ncbi:MAG: family 10 glycosylhydrolase [Candidatus Sumerlaeaceae bacterium]|nr:family 10 glycosylhydrolase [Candidatus Sumerlaeaceae bacterium]